MSPKTSKDRKQKGLGAVGPHSGGTFDVEGDQMTLGRSMVHIPYPYFHGMWYMDPI